MQGIATGTALVTGASSGIGEAYARRLAALGYDLILVARRRERLEAIAGELRESRHVAVEVLPADLSEEADIARVERRIEILDTLAMLVNNAGFGTTGSFADVDVAKLKAMMNVHVAAPTRLARAALPGMIARRRGALINVASSSAFVLFPGNTAYSATKRYVMTFSEGLGLELKGTGVTVQALCPGFTHSGFHDTGEFRHGMSKSFPEFLWMSAEEVAGRSLAALGRKRVVLVPGFLNRLLYVRLRRPVARLAGRMSRRSWKQKSRYAHEPIARSRGARAGGTP